MNNRRLFASILGVVLVLVIVVIGWMNASSIKTESKSSLPIAGMGELRVLEGQQAAQITSNLAIPVTGIQSSGSSKVGMGDFKKFELQMFNNDTAGQVFGHNYAGTGDPPRYRAK